MFNNIPADMRSFNQWVVWRYEDTESPKPTKVPYNARTNRLASVTDPSTWSTFDEAVRVAKTSTWYSGIGFVLTESDPFAFIDLDDTKGDKVALDRQLKIFNEFDTYAERSPSGKGLHLIVKGKVESGRRRGGIEVYSESRYMTMTGDVYRNTYIKECNGQLTALWEMLGHGSVATAIYAGLEKEKEPDEVILNRAALAANGEKFMALYAGKWQDFYPSQSEADFALVDIIAFYTQCRSQIVRLFHASELGKRDKAKRIDYVNYMLNKCFDRMLPPVDTDGLINQLNEAIKAKTIKQNSVEKDSTEIAEYLPPLYDVPPGLVGEIAQFVYAQAPRPVPEIALTAALGLVSGIVGRAYNVSGTGLNQYILLLAPTGTGKEAMASGINKLMGAVLRTVPASVDFVGPGEIASAPALIKYMSKTANSFVSVVGEFGLYLQAMANMNAPPHLTALRRLLLDLYAKSGEGEILRPSIYSDKDKNTTSISAPAFTLLGESTPEKFYEGLHEGLIVEGLLPRFTTIEYRGCRPPLNPIHMYAQPSFELIEKLSNLCAYALTLNSQNKAIQVNYEENAEEIFKEFDKYCDVNINKSDKEVKRHLWNRAHLKAIKLASLIAVGCNPYEPKISVDMTKWAINLVVSDIRNLLGRFDAGEIGMSNDETKQLIEVARVVNEYLTQPWSEIEKYKSGNVFLHSEKIIPYSYIHKRITSINIFRHDRVGPTGSLKRAVLTLTERGDLQEMSRAKLAAEYKTSARCFMVSNPKAFGF
jgi:hypothetical protein